MTASAALRIVIPVLNEADALPGALRALEDLRSRGAHVVVVDGGSDDGTAAIAEESGVEVRRAPRGRASQLNAGARGGDEPVLLFLHSDTRLPDGADDLVRAALEAGRDWGRFDVRIDSPTLLLRIVSAAMNERSHLTGIVTGDQAIFLRRTVFDAAGGFAELPLMEDVELSRRLRRTGRPARIRRRVVTSARRWEEHGPWRTIALMWRLRLEYALGADPQRLAIRYGYRPRTDEA